MQIIMVKVYVDERERASGIPDILSNLGLTIIYKMLDVGDYIVNEYVVIERKRVDDLIHSVFDGRFFNQVTRLIEYAEKPVLIIEGNLNDVRLLTSRWRAVEAALLTAIIRYGLVAYYTNDYRHTAEVIKYIAEKLSTEDLGRGISYSKATKPKHDDVREWQLFIVQSLPGIGPKLAHRLLSKFGSVRGVFNASYGELIRVEGISEDRANKIIKIITSPYGKGIKGSEDLTKYVNKD